MYCSCLAETMITYEICHKFNSLFSTKPIGWLKNIPSLNWSRFWISWMPQIQVKKMSPKMKNLTMKATMDPECWEFQESVVKLSWPCWRTISWIKWMLRNLLQISNPWKYQTMSTLKMIMMSCLGSKAIFRKICLQFQNQGFIDKPLFIPQRWPCLLHQPTHQSRNVGRGERNLDSMVAFLKFLRRLTPWERRKWSIYPPRHHQQTHLPITDSRTGCAFRQDYRLNKSSALKDTRIRICMHTWWQQNKGLPVHVSCSAIQLRLSVAWDQPSKHSDLMLEFFMRKCNR